jgi:hypothetical protein
MTHVVRRPGDACGRSTGTTAEHYHQALPIERLMRTQAMIRYPISQCSIFLSAIYCGEEDPFRCARPSYSPRSSWVQPLRIPTRPLLLQKPTLSKTQIAFVYAGDLWTVPREGARPAI